MDSVVEAEAVGWPSASVGDYLKAVWELGGETGPVSTSEVAGRLSVSPASVTSMLKRLQERDLARYERYHGATLTDRGREEALRLVRRHRLIETFLLEHLGYSWQDVHEEAERLEHAVSDEFTERLASLLGHPGHDPHGDPIPEADGTLTTEKTRTLSDSATGEEVLISRVEHQQTPVLEYLGERGLTPGKTLRVREVRELDGVVAVEDAEGRLFSLGESLARSIFVKSAGAQG